MSIELLNFSGFPFYIDVGLSYVCFYLAPKIDLTDR